MWLRPHMTRLLLPLLAAITGTQSTASAVEASPLALYGDHIEFDIYRNDARIGSHRVTFAPDDEALRVTTDFNIEVGALFITLFELRYRSDALWKDGRLVALSARTDRNGDITHVEAKANESQLLVRGPNGFHAAALGIYPTNHWNAGVIGSTRLVNTISGKVNEVRLVNMGTEQVITERGPVEATRYKYVGEIQNEVWYDPQGRWVAMQFPGDDGSLIELKCRKCFPTRTADATP